MILANIAFPWLWPHWRIALLLLSACMLAESLLVRPLASVSYPRALVATALVNVLSTLVGWPLRILTEWLVLDLSNTPLKYAGEYIFPILFLLTVLVEWPLFGRFLKLPMSRAFPISVAANSLSYLILEFTLGPIFRILR